MLQAEKVLMAAQNNNEKLEAQVQRLLEEAKQHAKDMQIAARDSEQDKEQKVAQERERWSKICKEQQETWSNTLEAAKFAHQGQIEQLKRDMDAAVATHKSHLEVLRADLEAAKATICTYEDKLKTQKEEIERLQNGIQCAEDTLCGYKAQIEAYCAQIVALKSDMAAQTAAEVACNALLEDLKREAQASKSALEEHIHTQTAVVSRYTAEIQSLTDEIHALKSDGDVLRSEKTTLTSDNHALQCDKMALKSDNDTLKSDNDALKKSLDDMHTLLNSVQTEAEIEKNDIRMDAERRVSAAECAADGLREELVGAQMDLALVSREVQTLKNTCSESSQREDQILRELGGLRDEVARCNEAEQRASREMMELREELAGREKKLELALRELAGMRERVNQLGGVLKESEGQRGRLEASVRALHSQLQVTRTVLGSMRWYA
jgi:chromosome segregation ATPase